MEVIANGQKIPFALTGEKNLAEVLQTLFLLSSHANKLIIMCKVNGDDINLLKRQEYVNIGIDQIDKIEITVENRLERVLESLDEITRILPMISSSFGEVANFLIAGQKHKSLTLFSSVLENWRQVIGFLKVIEGTYKIKFEDLDFKGKRVIDANNELYDLLINVKNAIENDDLVTVSDLIEYEIKDKLEEQKEIIEVIKKAITEKAAEVSAEAGNV